MQSSYWKAFWAIAAAFAIFCLFTVLPIIVGLTRYHTGDTLWPIGYFIACGGIFVSFAPAAAWFMLFVVKGEDIDGALSEAEAQKFVRWSLLVMLFGNLVGWVVFLLGMLLIWGCRRSPWSCLVALVFLPSKEN